MRRKLILKETRRAVSGTLLLFLIALNVLAGATNEAWRGVHLWLDNDGDGRALVQTLPALAGAGANVLVLEINYSYEFPSHPELRNANPVTRATAGALAAAAHQSGIRLIPEFNCLGHQTFGGRISPLLRAHPEFNETPHLSLTNRDVYCLDWCPSAPGLNEIVFSLIDDLADAFAADAIHVGMDEVYLIGADDCPRCRGKNPAALYAAQVRALHEHLAGRQLQMLMWADRVVGPKYQGVVKYDNARNDLSAAVDLIPKDIILCDWQYAWKKDYPSVPYLAGKGFQVWPAGFLPLKAANQLSDFARAHRELVRGYLATTWNETSITNSPNWAPIREILPRWRQP